MMHLLIIVWQTLVFRYQPPSVFCLTHDAGTDIYTGERTTVIDGTISGRATVVGVESVVLLEGTSRGVAEMKEGSGAANPVSFCYDENKRQLVDRSEFETGDRTQNFTHSQD
jgi:hypothetical protein